MKSTYQRDIERREESRETKKRIMWRVIAVLTALEAFCILFILLGLMTTLIIGALPESVRKWDAVEWVSDVLAVEPKGEGGSSSGANSSGKDTTPPTVKPKSSNTIIYAGKTVSYKNLISVSDRGGSCTVKVDSSAVDQNKPGTYTVKYTVTDGAGNVTKFELKVTVMKGDYTWEKLETLIESKAKTELGFTKATVGNRTKVQIVRAIYNYVNDPNASATSANIRFEDQSNTPAQEEQTGQKTRVGWETDWIEEAYRTLEMPDGNRKGDCYSYYSVSKAFFEYFGIENEGIQRSTRSTESGTHYWSIVKVEGGWYFYDATRLRGKFSDGTRNACLITEAKLQGYRTSKGGAQFYTLDKWDGFPTISTKAI